VIAAECIYEEQPGQGFNDRIAKRDRLLAIGASATQDYVTEDWYIFIPSDRLSAMWAKRSWCDDGKPSW
jgi:hypothetical protein